MPYAAPASTAVNFQILGGTYELPMGDAVDFYLEDVDGGRVNIHGTSSVMFESPHETINADFLIAAGSDFTSYGAQHSPTIFTVSGEAILDVQIVVEQNTKVAMVGKTKPRFAGAKVTVCAFSIAGSTNLRLIPAAITTFNLSASTVFSPRMEGRVATMFDFGGSSPMTLVGDHVRQGVLFVQGKGDVSIITDFVAEDAPVAEAVVVRSATEVVYVYE